MAKSTSGTGNTSGEITARRTPGRRKTDKAAIQVPAVAADRGGAVSAAAPTQDAVLPNWADVRMRAFELYLERGGVDGHDVDDWLEAEQQLRGRRE